MTNKSWVFQVWIGPLTEYKSGHCHVMYASTAAVNIMALGLSVMLICLTRVLGESMKPIQRYP